MAQTYYTLLTTIGQAKLANAIALGQNVVWSHMAVGDGNGNPTTPTQAQTALVRERYRAGINQLSIDPENANYLISELVIPTNAGGWSVAEVGIYDADGDMVAVSNFPATYKPVLEEGSGRDLVIRIIVQVSSTAAVTLRVDPTIVLATQAWVKTLKATQAVEGIARFSTPTETTATAPRNDLIVSPATLKAKLDTIMTGYMFDVRKWQGSNEAIPQGFVLASGVQLTELQVPGLAAKITSTGQPSCPAADWKSNALNRGKWGIGAGFVITPDYNGDYAPSAGEPASIGGLYFGGGAAGLRGNVEWDRGQGHWHATGYASTKAYTGGSTIGDYASFNYDLGVNNSAAKSPVTDGVNGTPRVGIDTQPKTVRTRYIIQIYGGVTGLLEYDVAAHIAEIAALKLRLNALEGVRAWQVVTPSRVLGVTYTNTLPYEIGVSATVYSNSNSAASVTVTVGGVNIATAITSENAGSGYNPAYAPVIFNVPSGATYAINSSLGVNILYVWAEKK